MSSADNFCKQYGPRSGQTKCRACSGSKLFDTQMVFLKEFFEKDDFEKISRRQKSIKISQGKGVNAHVMVPYKLSYYVFDRFLFKIPLFQKRRLIEREEELKPLTPIMDYPVESGRNLTLKTKDQVFSVIDTTLLKCYLNVSKQVKIQNNQPLFTVFALDILTVKPEQIRKKNEHRE